MAKLKLTLACWDYDRTRALIEGRVRPAGIDLDIKVLRPRQASWAARSIYQAFRAAKDLAVAGLYESDALQLSLPWLLDHVEEARRAFGEDFWSYGLEANRPALAALGHFVHEQGLAPRAVPPDELFAPDVE
jgi:hypothetical protein